jgi:hypothetical protein
MNFGEIKYTYNTLLAESLSNNISDGKVAFKKYIKTIKENAVLKTQFDIYYNLENKVESDGWKAFSYVTECLSLMDGFSKNEIKSANNKLNESEFIKENKVNVDSDKSKLYSAIDVLINTSKTSSNIDKIFEAKLEIVDYILNNKKESTTVEGYGLPNSVLSEIAVEKFNEEYGDLTDSEKEAISVSVGSDEIKKEELYTKTIKECLELVNSKLSESNGDVKEKLLATKENLLNRVYVKESFVNDISKVIELKKYLSDN